MVGSVMHLSHQQSRVFHWFLGNHILGNVFPETAAAGGRMKGFSLVSKQQNTPQWVCCCLQHSLGSTRSLERAFPSHQPMVILSETHPEFSRCAGIEGVANFKSVVGIFILYAWYVCMYVLSYMSDTEKKCNNGRSYEEINVASMCWLCLISLCSLLSSTSPQINFYQKNTEAWKRTACCICSWRLLSDSLSFLQQANFLHLISF